MPLDDSNRCTAHDSLGTRCGVRCVLPAGHFGSHAGVNRENNVSCDHFFYPANHPQDWMKDSALIRCGRANGHEGPHWPVPIPLQSANAGKDQPTNVTPEERQRLIDGIRVLLARLERAQVAK